MTQKKSAIDREEDRGALEEEPDNASVADACGVRAPGEIVPALAAIGYIREGWALVPVPKGSKGLDTKGWNLAENCIKTEGGARSITGNMGLAHAYSRTCALDFDNLERARQWLKERSVDPDALLGADDSVHLLSGRPNRDKLLFKLPDGISPLASKKVDPYYDEDEGKHTHALEFRCATADGLTVQDVLPPSIHPGTGRPYQWHYTDELLGDWRHLPELPAEVLDLWESLIQGGPSSAAKGESDLGDIERMVTLGAVTDDVMADLRSAMAVFTEEDADNYHFWAEQMGLALKSLAQAGREDEACAMWHAFSASSPRYDEDESERKWIGFNPNRITYKSIFEWASERHGWINPKSAEALKANATAATRIDRTDTGNTTLLAQITDGDLRYVPELRAWLSWNGQRWQRDTYGNAAQAMALEVAEHYHRQAAEIRKQAKAATLDETERKRIEQAAAHVEKWATQCRNKRAIDNMLNLAKGDARFTLPVGELDRDVWLLGVENGVVDLRTGQLREASRGDYVTRRARVAFNPAARAPRWLQFIEEITAEPSPAGRGEYRARPHVATYMQRALGYAITGSTAEHKMFIAIGEGSNGKNVLLDLLQWIMGDYWENIAAEALMATRHDADAERPTPSARRLAGARAAISSESKDGQRLDVGLVKRHTGGGYMTARGLQENTFTFEITHKLWLMTNHRPALDHMDEAMRGRLHLIPFEMRWNRPGVPDRDPTLPDGDKELPEKLKAEAEGVLAWLVAGAVGYRREGLEPPAEVARMTRDYFKDQDPLGLWLNECETCEPAAGTGAAELYDAFRLWCHSEGFLDAATWSQTGFSTKLKKLGIEGVRSNKGKRYGLRIREFPDLV